MHVCVVRVDRLEHVAVTGDLLLRPILGDGLLGHQRLDPPPRGRDPLDPVRRLGALDDRDLPQRLEDLRRLPLEEVFLAPVLADGSNCLQHPLLDRQPFEESRGEGLHSSVQSRVVGIRTPSFPT
jgi:hypothetical protein